MKHKIARAAFTLLVLLLLASAYGAGAFALSGTDPLLFADLNRADFEFQYVPQANSDYAIYLFSADGGEVQGRVEVFENGETVTSGEGTGEICSAWLMAGANYTIRVHGSGSAVIEVARQALSRSFAEPLQAAENEAAGKMIAHDYDAHWYTFNAQADTPVLLTCVSEDPRLRLEALLFDGGGNLISAFETLPGGACKLRFETDVGKQYFIRISAPEGGTGYYTLQIHRPESAAPAPVFDSAEVTLASGDEIDLSRDAGEALLWVSDNPSVAAALQNGMVLGLQSGEATITAYGMDSETSCKILVQHVPLEGLEITGEEIVLNAGDDADIHVQLQPANASDQRLRFRVENREIASVSREGILKALQSGETMLHVSSADGNFTDSIRILVHPAVRKYRALLVGEENYPFAEDALRDGSENSVQALAALLGTVEFEDAAYSVRTRKDLSRAELIAQIRETFNSATAQDISLLYITGHGSYSGGMSFLELSDGSTLSARDLERELRHISGTVVVFIDSCGSGGAIGAASERLAFAKGFTDAFSAGSIRGSKYKVIASAGLDEDSFRIAFNEHATAGTMATVFARALCDGAGWDIDHDVQGTMGADANYDGSITLGELQDYMTGRVNWYLNIASDLTGEDYRQSIQVYPEGDPLILFERKP